MDPKEKIAEETEPKEPPERLDLEWIAVGKRAGLSFTELNEFRVKDLAAYVDIYTGDKEDEEERPATQDDIDAFYGG